MEKKIEELKNHPHFQTLKTSFLLVFLWIAQNPDLILEVFSDDFDKDSEALADKFIEDAIKEAMANEEMMELVNRLIIKNKNNLLN